MHIKSLAILLPLLFLSLTGCDTFEMSARARNVPLPFTAKQIHARLANLKLTNYYPAANAQTNLWRNWHPDVIENDMARIAAIHANAVRIVVFPET